MGRSRGFGSAPDNLAPPCDGTGALFGLAFAVAPGVPSLSPAAKTQLAGSFFNKHAITPACAGALTACRHAVSGSVSLPSRGAFHRSLTVLVRYRSMDVLSL
jgi:hypothetical protein